MNEQMDSKTRRIGVETFVFRIIIVIILEMVLLHFGNVSIAVHLIVTSITLFTSSVVACVVFMPEDRFDKQTPVKRPRARKRRRTLSEGK